MAILEYRVNLNAVGNGMLRTNPQNAGLSGLFRDNPDQDSGSNENQLLLTCQKLMWPFAARYLSQQTNDELTIPTDISLTGRTLPRKYDFPRIPNYPTAARMLQYIPCAARF